MSKQQNQHPNDSQHEMDESKSSASSPQYDTILEQMKSLSLQFKTLSNTQDNKQFAPIEQIKEIFKDIISSTESQHKPLECSWKAIISAVEHELYGDIATKMWRIIGENNIMDHAIYYTEREEKVDANKKGTEFILNSLKTEYEFGNEETEYNVSNK